MDAARVTARDGGGRDRPRAPETWQQLQGRLLHWWAHHRRPLPFREGRTPWRVLVAEVMLQQTQAESVGPFLDRFLARFPDPGALAAADGQEVLALWQGLGYYSRARNLHRAAQRIVTEHAGRVPDSPEELLALPGVGPYIAGAVSSFAFGRDAAAFDANALRVLSRLFDEDRASPELALRILPPGRAADWNEALMDFGSLICVPRVPRCAICPVADLCAGRRSGRAAVLPVRPAKRPRPEVQVCALVVRDPAGRFGLVQRPEKGLLAGMWECPAVEGSMDPTEVAARYGLRLATQPVPLVCFRHVFTHRVWNMHGFSVRADGGRVRWLEPTDLPTIPLSGPTVRLLAGSTPAPCELQRR